MLPLHPKYCWSIGDTRASGGGSLMEEATIYSMCATGGSGGAAPLPGQSPARIIHEPLLRLGLFVHDFLRNARSFLSGSTTRIVGAARSFLVLDEHPGASLRGS